MIGRVRLYNLERCAEAVFRENVAGDFLKAGVCQGGAAIFLRGLHDPLNRIVLARGLLEKNGPETGCVKGTVAAR
jgi:hypothetical protein